MLSTRLPIALLVLTLSSPLFSADDISNIPDDYATLAIWEAAKNGDITALTGDTIAQISGEILGGVTVSGWTTDADSRIIITGISTDTHKGTADDGGAQVTSFGAEAFKISNSGSFRCDIIIEKLIVQIGASTGNEIAIYLAGGGAGSKAIFRYNVIYSTTLYTAGFYLASGSHDTEVYNNIMYDTHSSFFGGCRIQASHSTILYNNVFWNNYYGIRAGASTDPVLVKNNLCFENNSDFYGTTLFDTASTGNFSSDTTGDNDNLASGDNTANVTFSEGVDYISTTTVVNLHLVAGSQLIDAGFDVVSDSSMTVTTDIDYPQTGATFLVRNDVGADELAETPTPTPTSSGFPIILYLGGN